MRLKFENCNKFPNYSCDWTHARWYFFRTALSDQEIDNFYILLCSILEGEKRKYFPLFFLVKNVNVLTPLVFPRVTTTQTVLCCLFSFSLNCCNSCNLHLMHNKLISILNIFCLVPGNLLQAMRLGGFACSSVYQISKIRRLLRNVEE